MTDTVYSGIPAKGFYNVTFIVTESGEKLTRSFDSPYLARRFANKLRHSKKCLLVSYPAFP